MQSSGLREQKILTLAHHLKCEAPNAGRQARLEAGAQRTLEAVRLHAQRWAQVLTGTLSKGFTPLVDPGETESDPGLLR